MVWNVENILNPVQLKQLTAIQGTARSLERVQLQLATGKDVHSALDHPQNFFSSRALNNRSADLQRLLDGIGQSVHTIEEAQSGLDSIFNILDTAEAFLDEYMQDLVSESEKFEKVPVAPYTIETAADLVNYSGGQDSGVPASFIEGGFVLDDNSWRRFQIDHTISEDDVLTFEFRSTNIPEIAAIGFDNDNTYLNNGEFFFIYGTQTNGITYAAPTPTFQYDGSGDWVTVSIPVGQYFTGTFSHIVFVADDDGGGDDGDAGFRNIQLGQPEFSQAALDIFQDTEDEYIKILNQLDLIVKDAHYRGINLLGAEDLETFFNENHTSSLLTEGINATSDGLGLEREDFTTVEAVERKLDQILAARQTLREYERSLSNDFSILQHRLDFTRTTVNTLKSGHDDLILVDQNEAGAKLLALQTRQVIQTSVLTAFTPSILNLLT